ncbi:class E sortase [Candidatus Daviesbacteria bacterium]|nr:class E sortase [Candidatus Daviesbacteria bacterium]
MISSIKLLSLGFLSVGIITLMQVVLPIISFKLWEVGQSVNEVMLISPKPLKNSQVLGISIKNDGNFPTIYSEIKRENSPSYLEFSLSVPTLKLDQFKVLVDSNDLNEALAHLPGSALPGERGNVFISGHSALSWIFKNKKAPFANLMDLKKGDEMYVQVGGSKFSYEVVGVKIVDPMDLSVIAPPDNLGRYITLMTCVPPGLNTKRLVVLGKII